MHGLGLALLSKKINSKNMESSTPEIKPSDLCVERCSKFACMIQLCLQKNSEQEKACKIHIDAWKKCCDKIRDNGQTPISR